MNVLEAINQRRAVRAFKPETIKLDLIQVILNHAKYAASGVNMQPWQLACFGGQAKSALSADLVAAHQSGQAKKPDYAYYPNEWFEPYTSRRSDCGAALYHALGIEREDKIRREAAWLRNYHFFDAPCVLFLHIDRRLNQGSWFDAGLFLQNIMLAATHLGLGTCPMASVADYPDTIRRHAKLGPNSSIICGLALGYADLDAPVNHSQRTRANLAEFCQFHGFAT